MVTLILLFLIDVVLINASFLLSFFIRYAGHIPEVNFEPYKENFVFLTFVYVLAFSFARVFKSRFRSFWDLFRHIVFGVFLGTMFGTVFLYVFRARWASLPSSVLFISLPIGSFLIFTGNCIILTLLGKIKKKVIAIGNENNGDVLEKGPFIENIHIDTIEDLLQYEDVDEVVICERIHEDWQLNLLTYLLLKLRVNVVFSPAIYTELLSENVMKENSLRFLTTFAGRRSDAEEFLIRALDLAGSVLLLVSLSPLVILVALLTKLTSSGPVFYKQTRIAKDGGTFTLYKFRTMVNDAEKQSGPVLAQIEDKRVTKIGRFLRDTRIDEIPQLINVIRGDMSLVGPRPERPHFVKRHKVLREIRLAVKPGLTGLAQIRSYYDLNPKHKTKYDYLYIQRRSLLVNLYILAKTISIVLSKKGQ